MGSSKRTFGPRQIATPQDLSAVKLSGARERPAVKAVTSVFELEQVITHPMIGYFANVFHFQPDTEPIGDIWDILVDLIAAYTDRSQDALLPILGADCTLTAYLARRLQGGSPTASNYPRLVGTATQPVDTTAIAANIDLIPIEPPWQYGHCYLGGIPDDAVLSNTFSSTFLAKVATYAQTLVNDAQSAVGGLGLTWTPVIYSRGLDAGRIIQRNQVKLKPTALGRRLRPYSE